MLFQEFKKIPRLSRDVLVTEKLDGTNAQVFIVSKDKIAQDLVGDYAGYADLILTENETQYIFAGSRNRWLQIGKNTDNHGFASWVEENSKELFKLGEGRHYGEWMGKGINRGYGLQEKRFYLFNASKWVKLDISNTYQSLKLKQEYCPKCCEVVPVLYEGMFDTQLIDLVLNQLKCKGSATVQGYMNPEGIVIYHIAAGQYFKKTIENDEKHKGEI